MAENYNRGNVVVNRRSFVKGAFGAGMLGMLSLAGLTGCAPKSEQSSDIDGGTFDIVVIGAGGAGMTAAISSHDAGAKVILLEKMSVAGGNTVCAEGGMNACCTKVQAEEGIEDSVGYSYVLPVFSGFDGAQAVTDFYNALLSEMDAYARETVYETAQARHCVASVFGSYSLDGVRDNQLRVTYTVTADYAEGEDVTSTRTDAFDLTTGEHLLLE